MDVLDGDLEAVEAAGLRHLDLIAEVEGEVLVDDAVAGGEEGQHAGDEEPLAVLEVAPVLEVVGEVELLSGPEGGLGLLVHLPDLGVLDGEQHEALLVLHKKRLLGRTSSILDLLHGKKQVGRMLAV